MNYEKIQKEYDDHIENVVMKCNHDQDIVFAMMGHSSSQDDHTYVFKCSKCDGLLWELRHTNFFKRIYTPNEKYRCKWVPITTKEEPRLLPFVNKNVFDYARELFIDNSKKTWKDLK